MKAQESFISLPDSVGKYLFDFFINKADLSQSRIIIDDDEYSNTAFEWAKLSKWIDTYELSPQTTTFYKTCYHQRSALKDTLFPTQLYVAMKHDEEIFAFRVIVEWNNDRWHINNVDTDFYVFFEEGDVSGLKGFISLSDQNIDYSDEGVDSMDLDDVSVEVEPIVDTAYFADDSHLESDSVYVVEDGIIPLLRTDYESSVDISQPARMPLPVNFSVNVLGLLLQDHPYGDHQVFFTRHEYLDTQGDHFIKRFEKLLNSGVDLGEDREQIEHLVKYPRLLFEELIANWEALPNNLREEFKTSKLEVLHLSDIELEIENWDEEKGVLDTPLIWATINIPLSYQDIDAGIYCSAIWADGAWKLSHIQAFPYGIGGAEDVTVVDDYSEEAEIAVEAVEE